MLPSSVLYPLDYILRSSCTTVSVLESSPEKSCVNDSENSIGKVPMHDLQSSFNTRQEAEEAVCRFGRENGFAIVCKTSKVRKCSNGTRSERVVLACDRHGDAPILKDVHGQPRKPLREKKSKRCDCPFEVLLSKQPLSDNWNLVVRSDYHNHPPFDSPSEHPVLRRKDKKKVFEIIEAGIAAGQRPASIQKDIQKYQLHEGRIDDCLFAAPTRKDISNYKSNKNRLNYQLGATAPSENVPSSLATKRRNPAIVETVPLVPVPVGTVQTMEAMSTKRIKKSGRHS
mmetsp:Transcript_27977/g.47011  ORF Transcript_27977/g.47011 Transcript_27977/m.47011 type:complete len:285 (-) Transcript_27977:3-857(-)